MRIEIEERDLNRDQDGEDRDQICEIENWDGELRIGMED
jgi:hypothetical protein